MAAPGEIYLFPNRGARAQPGGKRKEEERKIADLKFEISKGRRDGLEKVHHFAAMYIVAVMAVVR